MTVLYLSDVYFPRVNGVSTSIATFRRELELRGVAVPLLCPGYSGRGEAGIARPAEARLVRLDGFRVPFDPEDRWVPARRFRAAESRLPAFDLVHVQTPFAAHRAGVDLARRRGVPVVETYHTYFEHYFEHYLPFLPAGLCRRLARRLTCRAARELDHLVVPSTAMRSALAAYGVSTPMSVLPTGIRSDALGDPAVADGAAFRRRHGIAADRPVLVHIGRIGHEKNLRFLLLSFARVVRELPESLLVVAGEGPARAELERMARGMGLGDKVLWLGYLDRERELGACFCAGDAFVFTSKTETQGLVLLEAMALGVPVVALAEMGTRDLLVERRGALVAEDDLEDFAGKCLEILRDPGLRARLAAEGPLVAADWSAAHMAGRLEALYRNLLD